MGIFSYELHYDVDVLSSQAKQIRDIEGDLRKAASDLTTKLSDLKNDWQSAAGDKFFSIYETGWVEHVEKYCDMLNEVATELEYASREYSAVTDALNATRF